MPLSQPLNLLAPRQPERRRYRRGIKGVLIIAGLAALASVAIVLAVGYASFREFATSQHAREDLIYSSTLRADLQIIYEQVLLAESTTRGFIITGEPEFLPELVEAREEIQRRLAEVTAFAVERPEHLARLARLERLIDSELHLLEQMVAARQAGDTGNTATTMIQIRQGKATMDHIADVVEDIADAEVAAIEKRTREVRVVGQRTKQTLTVLLAAAIAVVCGSTLVMMAHLAGRRRAERALGDTLSRHRAILSSAMDSILTVDADGRIESANPATGRLLGYDPKDLTGQPLADLFRLPEEQTGDAFFQELSAAASEGGGVRELLGQRRDGSTVSVDVAIGEMRASGGRSLVAVLHDITERKRAEVMKNEFVSTVSHELRTPLTSIAGSLGLLAGGATGPLPDKAQRLVTIAAQNCQRLVRLINDILDIEKMQSATITFARQRLSMADVARRAVEQNTGFALEHTVSLSLDIGPGDMALIGDADRLMQVMTNLISNAVKFSPAGSTVDVSVARIGRIVRASVRDHGTGIPESFRPSIFTRFAQADSSDTRQRGGTGLGLAIVKEIVDRHEGIVAFETEMGVGTAFHVDLPAEHPEHTGIPDQPAGSLAGNGHGDVLLVEDTADSAEVICAMLAGNGIQADVAATAAEAELKAHEARYKAILVDLGLPDRDGISLIRALRKAHGTRSVPILIVSARAPQGALAPGEAEMLQILDWIEKPVDPDLLASALKRALPSDAPLAVLHLDDDPDVRAIVRAALAPEFEVVSAASLEEARAALARQDFAAAIVDLGLPSGSGGELLPLLRRRDGQKMPVVIFSARDQDPAFAREVDAMLTKSQVSLDRLSDTVARLVRQPPAGL
ncbi:response regulator [Xanthobacteraceae bacterium A53D]